MRPLRISAISFLNTAPLMWDFEHGATPEQHHPERMSPELRRDFEIAYTVPSRCAAALADGTAFLKDPAKATELSRMRAEAAETLASLEEEWLIVSGDIETASA